jgi:Tfp pilus assembly protein PilV
MAAEAGFGLVEVMVTAVVIVLVSTATVTSISESQHTTARTLSRGITANLAEQDQERMRSMRAKDLADYSETRTVLQQGVTYTVDSRGEFVQDASGNSVSCTSSGSQTSYLRLTSSVTPQQGFRADPLTMRSIMALPVTQYSPTSGTLIVPLAAASGAPLSGVTVALSGPESRSATTNAEGCAIFQFLTPGAYTITVNQGGYVDTTLTQKMTYSGTVTPANVNTATPQIYDLAGALTPSFDGGATTNSPGITVIQSGLTGAGGTTRQFPTSGAGGLFPFTSPYAVYAGSCTANDPSAAANDGPTFYTDLVKYGDPATGKTKPFGQALIKGTSPATTTAVNLHEPTITPPQIQIQWRNAAGTTLATDQPGNSGNTARVYFKPNDSGCTLPTVPFVPANNNGTPSTTLRLPYGTYKVCAEYNKTVTGKDKTGVYSKVATYTAANTKFNGVSGLAALVIDTVSGTGDTNKMACSARAGF